MKIKIKVLNPLCLPKIREDGEWIDLHAAKDINLTDLSEDKKLMIPLGVIMKLPSGFEAILAPRSSSFKNYGIIQTNSIGIIDNSFCGPNDEWKLSAYYISKGKYSKIKKGDRICQFRIQLSQRATIWQKLKWLFSNKVTLIEENINVKSSRGGFGHSGVK